jgi:gamma-glutamyltranspeptidase/glutathione hydrolase
METLSYLQRRGWALAALLALLAGCADPSVMVAHTAAEPSEPAAVATATPTSELVVSDDRAASAAGLAMLARGGTAIDAAVAAQAVLGLVEPQHSGLGGGSVLLVWQAADSRLTVLDGTPRAGHDAPRGLNADRAGRPLDPALVVHGGGAVGAPGTLPALSAAHRRFGKLPWGDLFAPAIKLAQDGFAMPQALHDLLAAPGASHAYGEVAALYLRPDGTLPEIGATLRNPAYAVTLRRVAKLGPAGLYDGDALPGMMAALARGTQPSRLSRDDLLYFAATEDTALCATWREWKLCTAPPPAYGGLVALQMLGIAGAGDLDTPAFAHRFLDAGRLAQADRRRYAGDYVGEHGVGEGLLDPAYLAGRARLISPTRALAHPRPGEPAIDVSLAAVDPGAPTSATSQVVVVDRAGDVLSMTSSLTHLFGARVVAGGVVLNNALANFAPLPPSGVHYANEMAPDKRPATPVAPVIVFRDGQPVLAGGSGGGAGVPDFVAAAVLELLGNHRAPAEALARPHLSSADPDHVAVEAGTPAARLLPALAAMGHQVQAEPLPSGSAFVLRSGNGWIGAADPRRQGAAVGD